MACLPKSSDDLIEAIGSLDKVCKYIDIPLQHLSQGVLGRMRRPGAAAMVMKLPGPTRAPGLEWYTGSTQPAAAALAAQ